MTSLARLEPTIVVRVEPLDDHLTKGDARRHWLHADTNDRTGRRRHRTGRAVVALRLSRTTENQNREEGSELHAHPTRRPTES